MALVFPTATPQVDGTCKFCATLSMTSCAACNGLGFNMIFDAQGSEPPFARTSSTHIPCLLVVIATENRVFLKALFFSTESQSPEIADRPRPHRERMLFTWLLACPSKTTSAPRKVRSCFSDAAGVLKVLSGRDSFTGNRDFTLSFH